MSGGAASETAPATADPCALFGKLLATAVTQAGAPAQWMPSSDDFSGSTGSSRQLICSVYLEHPHQTTASLEDEQKAYISLPADQTGASACGTGSATTMPADLAAELSKLSADAGTVQQCGEANFEGPGGAWRAYFTFSGPWGNALPGNAQADNPQADQVLTQWLLGIGFNGRTLPKLPNRAADSTSVPAHLSQAQLEQYVRSQPCSLVPQSLVTKWMPGAFNQPPIAVAQQCQYGKFINGNVAGEVTVGFATAKGPLTFPSSTPTHVGALPALISNEGKAGIVVVWIERGIVVTVGAGPNSGSSSVTSGEILGLAEGIAGILQ